MAVRWYDKFLIFSVAFVGPVCVLAQQGAFHHIEPHQNPSWLHELLKRECTHETDKGKDYEQAGMVKSFIVTVAEDACEGKQRLKEYVCSDGHLLWDLVDCQNIVPDGVCKAGACVPASQVFCEDSDATELVDNLPNAQLSSPVLSMEVAANLTSLTTAGEGSGMGASVYLSHMKDACGKEATICAVPQTAYANNPELCDCKQYPGNCLDYSKVLREVLCVDNLNAASPIQQLLVYKQFDCSSVEPYGACLDGACVKDQDKDGILDPHDECPCDSGHAEFKGCPPGTAQLSPNDTDQDKACNPWDNCPDDFNPNQTDMDQDGIGDVCDHDTDGDGIQNDEDNCPLVANETQTDLDGDGFGNACDDDIDGDGLPNQSDNCSYQANPGQEDADKDGKGDVCDNDGDNDGVVDNKDNCPELSNPDQEDSNSNGFGDSCDDSACFDMSGLQAKAPWPMLGYCPQHQNRSPYNGPGKPELKWTLDLSQIKGFPSDAHFYWETPVIAADGTLYLSAINLTGTKAFFVAVHPKGSVKWFHMFFNDYFSSSAAIGKDGTIYVATDSHKLYAFQPNKNIKWIFAAPHEGSFLGSSPVIAPDGTIYLGSSSGYLYAIAPDGDLVWSTQLKQGIASSPLLLASGNIVVAAGNEWVAVSPTQGKIVWSFEVASTTLNTLAHHMALIHPNGSLFAPGALFHYLLDPKGTLLSKIEGKGCDFESQQALGKDQNVYCIGIQGLQSITKTGSSKLVVSGGGGPLLETIITGRNGTLYGQRSSGDNTQVKAFTPWGAELWTYETSPGSTAAFKSYGGSGNVSPVIGADSTLYFIDGLGLLHAIGSP